MIDETAPPPIAYPLPHDGPRKRTDLVVLHYTAGYTTALALRAMERRSLSAHAVIERDGTVTTCAHSQQRCRHAGGSQWGGLGYVNSRSLGVELVNFGYVTRDKPRAGDPVFDPASKGIVERVATGKIRGYRDEGGGLWAGTRTAVVETSNDAETLAAAPALIPDHRQHPGAGWAIYPHDQLVALADLLAEWLRLYDLPVEAVVGHEHVARNAVWADGTWRGKVDPGPAFPWAVLYEMLDELLENHDRTGTRHSKIVSVCLQSHLDRLGCRPGAIDGAIGDRTLEAVQTATERFGELYAFHPYDDGMRGFTRRLVEIPGFDAGRGA